MLTSERCPECGGRTKFGQVVTVNYPREEWEARGKMYDAYYCRNVWHLAKHAEERTSALMASSGLTAKEMELTLDDILDRGDGSQRMIAVAKSVLGRRRYFMTTWGGSGNGKSKALWAMTSEHLRRGESAIYSRVDKLLDYLRDGYADRSFRKSERYNQIVGCKFLALDEPDKVNYTGWAREIFFSLLDDRYLAGKRRELATALAMNDNPETLPSYIISRLRYDMHSEVGFAIIENKDPDGRESGL